MSLRGDGGVTWVGVNRRLQIALFGLSQQRPRQDEEPSGVDTRFELTTGCASNIDQQPGRPCTKQLLGRRRQLVGDAVAERRYANVPDIAIYDTLA